MSVADLTDVAIVGGGFGGAFAAHALDRALQGRPERAVLVAPENFLLFSPLLPEVASGTVEPRHAVIPLRSLLRRIELLAGTVTAVDLERRVLSIVDANGVPRELGYRALVLAPGSIPMTLPIPGLASSAVGFKSIADAIWLRNRLFGQLEAAAVCEDPARLRELLTFTFVGGGYAGVEALAELESLAREALPRYPSLRPADFRWVLIEAQQGVLPGLDARLARYTERYLRSRGVELLVETRLTSCVDHVVTVDRPEVAPYRSETIVWTTGQRPSPLVADLGVPLDAQRRVVVDDHCAIPGHPGTFVVGDAAAVPAPEGGTAPPTAQHAVRQARTAARNAAAFLGVGSPRRFRYRTRGLAVTLGKWNGAAQVKRFTFTGFVAWWMGRSYHLLMMPGLGRKSRVVADWTVALCFPRDATQLGPPAPPPPLPAPPGPPVAGAGADSAEVRAR